ncbi:MAG: B12-binding domain-containing radical SAM protein [Saccharofermentanales bacterium]
MSDDIKATRVLLIYPYFYTGIVKDQIFPPLGISILSAVLKSKGIDVMKIDCTFMTADEAVDKAKDYKPDITGIYIMTTLVKNALSLLEKLKKSIPDSVFITGGPLPTLYPERFAKEFDFVFKGEAAHSFPDFCEDIRNGNRMNPDKYTGIFSTKYKSFDTPPNHLSKKEIDDLPLPDRSGFDHEQYQKLSYETTGKKKTSIMMTYGCPFSCDFCSKPVFGNVVRYRDIDRIFDEIKDIISYGYDSLWIADDLFTCNPKFLTGFCERLANEDFHISWSCLSRVDCITDKIAGMMKKADCSKVYLGIESGNDSILKLMNKQTDIATIRKGVETFIKNGIECAGFFIVGYPGETMETIEDTFAFALSLRLDEISFNVPYPLPGSGLFEKTVMNSDDDWVIENETRFLYKSEFDEKWLNERINATMKTFGSLKDVKKQ